MTGKKRASLFGALLLAVSFNSPGLNADELNNQSSDDFYNLDAVDNTETVEQGSEEKKQDGQPPVLFEIPTRPLPNPSKSSEFTKNLRELDGLGRSTISGSGAESRKSPTRKATPTKAEGTQDWSPTMLMCAGIVFLVAILGGVLISSGARQRAAASRSLPEKLEFPDPDNVDESSRD